MRLPAARNDFPLPPLLSTDHLLREIDERLRGVRLRLIDGDRHAGRGRLADLHGLPDDRREHRVLAQVLQRIKHVTPEDRAAVVEGGQEAQHPQVRVQPRLHRLDDAEERRDALQRVVLRLHRDDDAVRRDERVQREETERWRAVDEDVVVAVEELGRELVAKGHLAPDRAEELDLGRGELDRRRRDIQTLRAARHDDRLERDLRLEEDIRHALLDGVEIDAEADGEVRLRVEVDAEDPLLQLDERPTEIDGAGRLADAALLIRERDDLAQTHPPRRVRRTVPANGTRKHSRRGEV